MGIADLGVEVQLKEIEQGLMDLLAARPQEKSKRTQGKRPEPAAKERQAMSAEALLAPYFARLRTCSGLRWQGRVTQVIGPLVESEGPFCSVGESCQITDSRGRVLAGEIVGFRGTDGAVDAFGIAAAECASAIGFRPGESGRRFAWATACWGG